MKNLIALFCAATVGAALAASTVESGNTFGVLRVDVGASAEEAIIAVPWLACSTGESPIKVTDVVKTANLRAGDQLYYYDTTTKKYQAWELSDVDGKKTWIAATSVSETGTEAGSLEKTLERGNAILLKRPNTARAASVYLYGQVPTTGSATITMAKGTSDAMAYTLIAPPSSADTKLSSGTWSNVAEGDMIVMAGQAPFKYDASSQKWGHKTVEVKTDGTGVDVSWKDTEAAIPAGQGAWYISAKGTATAAAKWTLDNLPHVDQQ